MQRLRAFIGIPGDPAVLREILLREFIDKRKPFRIHLPLREFAIPGDLLLDKEIVVHTHVVRDEDNLNDEMFVEFKAATQTSLYPSFRGVLDVYPADYGTEAVLEITGTYTPPLGLLGLAIDSTVGYLIAQRSMNDFLQQIAHEIRAVSAAK